MAKILVIDDEQSICAMLQARLEKAGHEVESTVSGNRGLRMIRENPPDVVITDIVMPEVEGMEIIKKVFTEFPDIPVIAISGYVGIANLNYLTIAQRLGARRVFTKPVDNEKLIEAVEQLTAKRATF